MIRSSVGGGSAEPAKPKFRIQRGIVYVVRDQQSLRADVYVPESDGPHPAVLVVGLGKKREFGVTQYRLANQAAINLVKGSKVHDVVSFLTLFSMMKVFRYVFWRSPQDATPPMPTVSAEGARARVTAVAALVVAGIVLGLGAAWATPYAVLAAEQLLDPAAYCAAVLGGT